MVAERLPVVERKPARPALQRGRHPELGLGNHRLVEHDVLALGCARCPPRGSRRWAGRRAAPAAGRLLAGVLGIWLVDELVAQHPGHVGKGLERLKGVRAHTCRFQMTNHSGMTHRYTL